MFRRPEYQLYIYFFLSSGNPNSAIKSKKKNSNKNKLLYKISQNLKTFIAQYNPTHKREKNYTRLNPNSPIQ